MLGDARRHLAVIYPKGEGEDETCKYTVSAYSAIGYARAGLHLGQGQFSDANYQRYGACG